MTDNTFDIPSPEPIASRVTTLDLSMFGRSARTTRLTTIRCSADELVDELRVINDRADELLDKAEAAAEAALAALREAELAAYRADYNRHTRECSRCARRPCWDALDLKDHADGLR